MVSSPPPSPSTASGFIADQSLEPQRAWRNFSIAVAALVLLFSPALLDLTTYSLKTSLYSHILLIPVISLYLISQKKRDLPPAHTAVTPASVGFALIGFGILGAWLAFRFAGSDFSRNDNLVFIMAAFVPLLIAAVLQFLGVSFARSITFPLAFLVFLIPFPDRVSDWIEIASQHASAEVYSWMMDLSQATYFREGLVFALPNLTIQVAQECSGIRSSFVLFITSLLAAYMFLRTPWKRAALALAVFPLGIIRNAFRIYVLSMLSVHWNPDVIHSPLHHRGGPIFFVLSLIPFFIFMLYLRKTEKSSKTV